MTKTYIHFFLTGKFLVRRDFLFCFAFCARKSDAEAKIAHIRRLNVMSSLCILKNCINCLNASNTLTLSTALKTKVAGNLFAQAPCLQCSY